LNQKNYILKTKRITAVDIDAIKNITFKIRDDTGDHTKGVNGDKLDTTVTERQKREQESNNNSFDKLENNKHSSIEEEQNTVRNKLKEDFQITWHKVRLLQISEREKLPKLKKTEN
jgi:hypothetical protein